MGGKKITGRKRHIAVDTQGNLLYGIVHAANIADRDGFWDVIDGIHERFPSIIHAWADGGYLGCEALSASTYGIDLEIIKKQPDQHTFIVLPRRWVVERTFAWLNRYRVLSKEYTHDPLYSEAFLYLASAHRMIKRYHPNKNEHPPYEKRKRDRVGNLLDSRS